MHVNARTADSDGTRRVKGETKSITTTASVVVAGTPNSGHYTQSAIIRARTTNTDTVFLGGQTVDNTGFILAAGDSVMVDITNESLYAVANSGTQELRVLRRGE